MKTIYTFYKNSNTGEIVMKQHFSGISFKSPDYFYDWNNKSIGDLAKFQTQIKNKHTYKNLFISLQKKKTHGRIKKRLFSTIAKVSIEWN